MEIGVRRRDSLRRPGEKPGPSYNIYNIIYRYIDFAEKSFFQDFHDFFQGRTEMDGIKVFLFDESKA